MPAIDLPLAELERYTGRNARPADFDAYWARGLAEMRATDPRVELVPAKIQTSFAECFHLYFTGVRGARVHAKLLRPRAPKARCPALLRFHGYSGDSGDFADKLGWVAAGFVVAALDVRGISRVTVRAGHVALQRVSRAPGVRAVAVMEDGATWAIFATAPERCVTDEHHCALRATGVAPLLDDASGLPPPVWLAAHPFDDDPVHNVRFSPGHVDVVARDETGAAIWRRFAVDDATPRGAAPLPPERESPLEIAVAAHDWAPRPLSGASAVPVTLRLPDPPPATVRTVRVDGETVVAFGVADGAILVARN
ncbi:MAG TPA: acetylxylan esterase, partial [Polyangiaceae bacterium]|nr:acetylxylan esterase [Polyangiaceae bacterium]